MNSAGGWSMSAPTATQHSWQWTGKAMVCHEALGNDTTFYGAYRLELNAGAGGVIPRTNNSLAMGWGDRVWTAVYAQNGAIQPSLASVKTDFAPLDPAACVDAVLNTDWVSFTYIPPNPPEQLDIQGQATPPDQEEPQARIDERQFMKQDAAAQFLAGVDESAYTRQQKGYVLQSPDHRTADLFGLSDRASASPSSDLAVVACALQNVLQRLAALENRPVLTPQNGGRRGSK